MPTDADLTTVRTSFEERCETTSECLRSAGPLTYCYDGQCACVIGAAIKDGECRMLETCQMVTCSYIHKKLVFLRRTAYTHITLHLHCTYTMHSVWYMTQSNAWNLIIGNCFITWSNTWSKTWSNTSMNLNSLNTWYT